MDRRSIKFDWNHARAFLVTAEEGSLSAAARALGMAQPTLGRQVTALEDELGVVLFERVGRGLTLTPSGEELLEYVRNMGDAANQMSLKSFGQSQIIEGKVRIAISDIYAAFSLPKIIQKLHQSHPAIQIDIVSSSTASDLLRREADIAVRNFRPTEQELVAKKLKDVPARLYATPNYIAKIGHPKTPAQLANANFIGIDDVEIMRKGLNQIGLNLKTENFSITTHNWLVMWAFVTQGLGIGVLDGEIGDLQPEVKRVLPDLEPMAFPMWLVAHRDLNNSRRIRIVFDLLAEELSN